jgi:thioredoxin 1
MEGPLDSIGRDYKVRRVNVDNNQALAQRYKISAIPALLIFKDGQIAERYLGVTAEEKLREALKRAGARPRGQQVSRNP